MPASPFRKPQTRNPERTRGRLLKAAIALFSAKGFHGVSVDDIAAKAKANKRLVYHYFGNKEQIYLCALEDVFNRLAKATPAPESKSSLSPDKKLEALFRRTFDFLDANPEFIRLLLWENLEEGCHLAEQPQRLNKNPFMDYFGEVVDEGVRQGVFKKPLDRRHLLVNFIGLCFIYYSNRHSLAVSLRMKDTPKERKQRAAQIADLVLDGLRARR